MRRILLSAAFLLAGCATTHMHIGDCASCAGYVRIQADVSDQAQTKVIYGEVGKALQSLTKPAPSRASVAPVRSSS